MTTLPEHGWYMRQMDDAADYGEAVAERLWHGPRIVSPSPRYDVAAVIDSIIDGTYEAKPSPVPQSLQIPAKQWPVSSGALVRALTTRGN